MIVEICANSFESAQAAQLAGANRIELCRDLSVGGLTPLKDTIEKVMQELTIPVHVLIRPRRGNFCYTELELQGMLDSISLCKNLGCAGVVSGVLTSEKVIDKIATNRLLEASQGLEFTFHRAFDECANWRTDLAFLTSSAVTRLLSSGQQLKAIDGLSTLKEMKKFVKKQLQIMPGGGINEANVVAFKEAGFDMVHFSATKKNIKKTAGESMFKTANSGHSNQQTIENMIALLS